MERWNRLLLPGGKPTWGRRYAGPANVGQASRLPSERASASGSVTSALPTEAGETPALHCGSWRASFRFCASIGTMNPPLAPPRRGTDKTRTNACSPPWRGRGWVGSWEASARPRTAHATCHLQPAPVQLLFAHANSVGHPTFRRPASGELFRDDEVGHRTARPGRG